MAVGTVFCEDDQIAQKTHKSAFLMGLLAPSILLAIISQPPPANNSVLKDPSKVTPLDENRKEGGALIDFQRIVTTVYAQNRSAETSAIEGDFADLIWVWLLWNDGPGGVKTALVLFDVELPVGIEVS